jgi:hypothetical protein
VCSASRGEWVEARHNLVTDFIPLVECITDAGQSKWSLHFELDSNASLSRHGGVMFVYMPTNLGKVQKQRPEILGFVGTSSPVLSMDIIERNTDDKTLFANGFREIFESLLVSCLDGRIVVVNSPRIPVFESPDSPLSHSQKSIPLRSVDRLKSYITDQLQDSSQQHALFNGCLVDYVLKVDSASNFGSNVLKDPSFSSEGSSPKPSLASFKYENLVKYARQSFSKSSLAQKIECVKEDAAAAHKKTCLEQQLLRRIFRNMKVRASIENVQKEDQGDVGKRKSLILALSSEKEKSIDIKISRAFVANLFEIYRLQQAALGLPQPISPVNFMANRPVILSNRYASDFIEMSMVLSHLRKTIVPSLGYQ